MLSYYTLVASKFFFRKEMPPMKSRVYLAGKKIAGLNFQFGGLASVAFKVKKFPLDIKSILSQDEIKMSVMHSVGTVGQKTEPPPPLNFNTNYRREMKFVPTNMDFYLFQFVVLKFYLGVYLHRVST